MSIANLFAAACRTRTAALATLIVALIAQLAAVSLHLTGRDGATVVAVTGIGYLASAVGVTLVEVRAAAIRRALTTARAAVADLRGRLADATTDPVTGLPLRRVAETHLAAVNPAEWISVAVIDVDDMHGVNNDNGHQFGDRYLAGIADQLVDAALPGDLIARLGGDEFVYLTRRAPKALAARLAATTARPIRIGYRTVRTQLSIGICHVRGGDPHTAFGCADLAMYTAKRRRSRIEHYNRDRDGIPLPVGIRPPMRRRDRHPSTAWPIT